MRVAENEPSDGLCRKAIECTPAPPRARHRTHPPRRGRRSRRTAIGHGNRAGADRRRLRRSGRRQRVQDQGRAPASAWSAASRRARPFAWRLAARSGSAIARDVCDAAHAGRHAVLFHRKVRPLQPHAPRRIVYTTRRGRAQLAGACRSRTRSSASPLPSSAASAAGSAGRGASHPCCTGLRFETLALLAGSAAGEAAGARPRALRACGCASK